MTLRFDDADFRANTIGMPVSHAEKFRETAQMQQCLLVSRAVGPTCRQLLEQGYDTKGFRIHGKSCDWGPMAGFVLRDPRFNKYGLLDKGATYNRNQHRIALTDRDGAGWTADTTPLQITEERRVWLVQQEIIDLLQVGDNRYDGWATCPVGPLLSIHYRLLRLDAESPWGVYLDNQANGAFRQEVGGAPRIFYESGQSRRARKRKDLPFYQSEIEAVLAMTNPATHRSWPDGDFRNAVTGDYDLMAIWPLVEHCDPQGKDRRVLGTARGWSERYLYENVLERNFTTSGQATKLGNITGRIYEICQLLNSAIAAATTGEWGPFKDRMVCWHSDESARPFVDDVDLKLVVFSPSGLEIGIETIEDFKALVDTSLTDGFSVTLAEGWTLEPDQEHPNRLGSAYRPLVPEWERNELNQPKPADVPDYYNA